MDFSSSCVFPCCCALSPAENRPVCQTHALYGNREMWASGERCSYFKRKSSLLLSEVFFHPWYGHKGAFPLLWQKMWSRVVLYVCVYDILSANQCIRTERPSLKLFLNRKAVLLHSLDHTKHTHKNMTHVLLICSAFEMTFLYSCHHKSLSRFNPFSLNTCLHSVRNTNYSQSNQLPLNKAQPFVSEMLQKGL